MVERKVDRFRPNLILGLSSKVETVISGCYATFIGSNRSLVRSPLAGYLGGSVARYVKVKEAEKSLMSAQNSSFEVRRRGAPSSARWRSGPHGGLCMSRSELPWSGHVGPAQLATADTLGCNGGRDSRFSVTVPETLLRETICGPAAKTRPRTDAETGYGLGKRSWCAGWSSIHALRRAMCRGEAGKDLLTFKSRRPKPPAQKRVHAAVNTWRHQTDTDRSR